MISPFKIHTLLLTTTLGLLLVSCDSTLMTTVSFGPELTDAGHSVIDYDLTLADSGTGDRVYLEFVTGQALDPGTEVRFYGQSGDLIATATTGQAAEAAVSTEEERSYAYSVGIEGIRSKSLIHEVVIGH